MSDQLPEQPDKLHNTEAVYDTAVNELARLTAELITTAQLANYNAGREEEDVVVRIPLGPDANALWMLTGYMKQDKQVLEIVNLHPSDDDESTRRSLRVIDGAAWRVEQYEATSTSHRQEETRKLELHEILQVYKALGSATVLHGSEYRAVINPK